GADFALSHGSVAVQTIVAMLRKRELIVVGEGIELFIEKTPPILHGKSLGESGIRQRTGLNVVGIQRKDELLANPQPDVALVEGSELIMLGTPEQRLAFLKAPFAAQ